MTQTKTPLLNRPSGFVSLCGQRFPGLYLCTNTADQGVPLWQLIEDPVQPFDWDAYHFAKTGQNILEMDEHTVYIYDWLGSSFPEAMDWLQEGRRFGFSTRLAANKDQLSKMADKDWVYHWVHPRAYLLNAGEFYAQRAQQWCPKSIPEHLDANKDSLFTCAGLLLETFLSTEKVAERAFTRTAPSFEYRAFYHPPNVIPQFTPGVILRLPKSFFHFEIVEEVNGDKHEKIANLLDILGNDLPYEIVTE